MRLRFLKFLDKLIGLTLICLYPSPRKHSLPITINSIAVIKQAAMGDALCLMPAIRLLKTWYPKAKIIWCTTYRSNPALFHNLPFIDHIFILPTSYKIISKFYQWKKLNIDVCIDADQYYLSSQLLALQSKYATGFITPVKPARLDKCYLYNDTANEKKQFNRLITNTFKKKAVNKIRFQLPEILTGFRLHKNFLEKITGICKSSNSKIVCIYPGSSFNASFRRWDKEHYKNLSTILLQQGYTICFAGGKDECAIKDYFNSIESQPASYYNLINEWTLFAWFWFLKNKVDLFIGNDAGLIHVAEAANIPIIGLFGPNIGSKWGSLNPDSITIEIPIGRLSCRPCIRAGEGKVPQKCSRGDLACLNYISVERVLKAAQKILQKDTKPKHLM